MSDDLHRRMLLGTVGLAGVAALTAKGKGGVGGVGGPLNPPAGAVSSTSGPEPRTPISAAATPGDATSLYLITQPGSYYLTGNISGVAGKRGIGIAVSGVSIDLNGLSWKASPTPLWGSALPTPTSQRSVSPTAPSAAGRRASIS